MNLDIYELSAKALVGEKLTDGEKKKLRDYNAKYALVRYVYLEKMKHEGSRLTQFHFTPGESFMHTPVVDIVNGLLKINQQIKNGDYEVADFGDSNLVGTPPNTGKTKTTLVS
jgi:hypothetical protein